MTAHVFTLNETEDQPLVHLLFDGEVPLCGWAAKDDEFSADLAKVTCRDCQAAAS